MGKATGPAKAAGPGRRVAVVGCGSMGSAIVQGLLRAGWTSADRITASHHRRERAAQISKDLGVRCLTSNAQAAEGADAVILSVKPQIVPEVLGELAGHVQPTQLVASIAAGVSTATLEAGLPGVPVVRTMPNLAATVGLGATAMSAGSHASRDHLALARGIFESVGIVEEVPEKLMDAVTGLSGTGPMYVFHLAEAMADAGVKMGLSRDVATRLSLQTMLGSARLAQDSRLHPAALKDQVTSPAGTAIAALHVLRREAFQAIIMDAVEAATRRSQELGH